MKPIEWISVSVLSSTLFDSWIDAKVAAPCSKAEECCGKCSRDAA